MTFEIREDVRGFYATRGIRREEEYAENNLRPTFKSGRTFIDV